jgi:hypothetical protein
MCLPFAVKTSSLQHVTGSRYTHSVHVEALVARKEGRMRAASALVVQVRTADASDLGAQRAQCGRTRMRATKRRKQEHDRGRGDRVPVVRRGKAEPRAAVHGRDETYRHHPDDRGIPHVLASARLDPGALRSP